MHVEAKAKGKSARTLSWGLKLTLFLLLLTISCAFDHKTLRRWWTLFVAFDKNFRHWCQKQQDTHNFRNGCQTHKHKNFRNGCQKQQDTLLSFRWYCPCAGTARKCYLPKKKFFCWFDKRFFLLFRQPFRKLCRNNKTFRVGVKPTRQLRFVTPISFSDIHFCVPCAPQRFY